MVGSRQAKHKLYRELMEKDDMVNSRVNNAPNTKRERQTDEGKKAASPKELIKKC